MKKKLLLVYPKFYSTIYDDITETLTILTKKSGILLNVSLATVAALTPSEFDLKIIDENISSINFDEFYDLVGITGFTSQIYRAEKIAAEFSKRGIPIACGGPSVTLSPERWRHFADIMIIGEAERIWPQFTRDFLAGSFKQEYRETERFDLSLSPIPDYSGFAKQSIKKYITGIVQTSRGCPYNCEFCDVHIYMGRKMRYKPVEKIIREIEQLSGMGMNKFIYLADDNFSAHKQRAKKILKTLQEWNIKQRTPVSFMAQVSIEAAGDEEFLELAAAAGLTRVFVGIETPNLDSLKETGKLHNVINDMLEDIKKFHNHGILVESGCIVGFDSDNLSIFQQQFEFLMQAGIPIIRVVPLQAPDGTHLKERMVREGRYIDWKTYAEMNPGEFNLLNHYTIIPKQMTTAQLKKGVYWLLHRLYNPENFVKRLKTFFENYERSPVKHKLKIPGERLDLEGLKVIGRVLKYLLSRHSKKERNIFWNMYRFVRHSSHPQRFSILIWNFLELKNMQEILARVCPEISQITYPE